MSQPYTPPPSSTPATVSNNLVLAIVATVLSLVCCLPHGLVSLIFALQVNKKVAAGDIDGATNSARQAKLFAWISIIVAAVYFVISMVFGLFGIILSAATSH